MAEGKCNQAPVPLLWLEERSCWREGLEMSVPDDEWDRCRFYGTEMRSLTDDPACSNSWTLPVMLVCSKNILIVLLIRILQADLKLLEIYLLMGLSDSYSKKKNTKKKVPLISTSTSRARACISVLVHQQTSDLHWMRVSRRQCVQGNGKH